MKRIARTDADEPVVAIPRVVKPIEVELAIRLVAIDDEHVRVAVGVKPYIYARCRLFHRPLNTLRVARIRHHNAVTPRAKYLHF